MKTILFFYFIILSNYTFSQNCNNTISCNLETLSKFQNNIEIVNDSLAIEFLLTFSEKCKNNVEYSEWSNELLFSFLNKYPHKFIELLTNVKKLDKKYILKNLEEPINDGINVDSIICKIENITNENSIKNEILFHLKIANR